MGSDACKEEILPEIFLYLYVSHFYENRDSIFHALFCDLPFSHSVYSKHLSLATMCFFAVSLEMLLW